MCGQLIGRQRSCHSQSLKARWFLQLQIVSSSHTDAALLDPQS